MYRANDLSSTRRNVLRNLAAGSAVAGVSALGGASVASADDCDLAPGCYVTIEDGVGAYDECPADGGSHVWSIDEGEGGMMQDTCTDRYGNCYVLLDFCDESWWVSVADIEFDDDYSACFC